MTSSTPAPTMPCLVVEAQRCAGVDVFTDGEQRRDNYACFVGARLDLMRTVSAGP